MKLKQMKNILLFIALFFINIYYCTCFRPDDEEEIRRLLEDLMKKKNEYSEKKGEEEIYIIIMKGLIGTIIFFIIIIISCAAYEIINCCMEAKRELERKEIIAKNIQKSKNVKNFSLKLSNDSSSSTDDDKNIAKVENSFRFSNMSANNGVKEDYNNNSNNIMMEKPNLEDSNYCRLRKNSGNEAPIVQEVVKDNDNNNEYDYNNKEEKLLTNEGNIKNEDNLNNPFEI